MLSDAQIERWSRQILVPEIGGRGQARLCAAIVEVVGAPALAIELIERAGPRVTPGAPDVAVRWTSTAAPGAASRPRVPTVIVEARATAATVAAVVTWPCAACLVAPAPAGGDAAPPLETIAVRAGAPAPHDARLGGGLATSALARVSERVVAALVAAEVVRLLVVPDATGRVHRIDLAAGTFTAEPARAAGDCAVCGAPA